MHSRVDPSQAEFDQYYEKPDPWGINNSPQEMARREIFDQKFAHCSFSCGLDIGCGEGDATNAMSFVEKIDAVDISRVALARAKSNYPHINFSCLDIRDISELKDHHYDFVSCLETLYYVSDKSERERIISDICNKGKDNCVFLFSAVTVGENEHRRYFYFDELSEMLGVYFNILDIFPIRLGKVPMYVRIRNKILRHALPSFATSIYKRDLQRYGVEAANQNCFVCVKK